MDRTEDPTDNTLISEFLKGKVKAFDLLYEKYSERLYGFAFMLLKNKEDARDVVQETFLKIWLKRHELDEYKSFKSFVFTISYNVIIDLLRKRLHDKKFLESLEKNFRFDQSCITNMADFNILDKQIKSIIDELPLRRKQIYILSRENGLSNKNIAENLNISVKTVETQLNLAIKFLKMRLSDAGLSAFLLLALFY